MPYGILFFINYIVFALLIIKTTFATQIKNMSVLQSLQDRSQSTCELCTSSDELKLYATTSSTGESVDNSLLVCSTCLNQIEAKEEMDANHWRCLNDSMWNEHVAVQIMSWRMLQRLRGEGWPKDLLDMMYLDDEAIAIARETGEHEDVADKVIHRDINGVVLQAGDSVVLIKDLKVKGSSLVAKQGTAVRNIRLDRENEKFIEGKVGPTQIVIITDYVKKL